MRSLILSTIMALTALALGCAAVDRDFGDAGRDVTPSRADSGLCERGQWYCLGGGLVARQCDGRGGFVAEENCASTGRACFPTIGCRVCEPGRRRCSPGQAQLTQVCADDGSRWLDGQTCDSANGVTCNDGLCEDRCNPRDPTYLGCEYWPTTTANPTLAPTGFSFGVVVSNPQTYPVEMDITGGALAAPIHRTLAPGTVETVELPWIMEVAQLGRFESTLGGRRGPASSVRAQRGAYRVQTNGPVAAYQFNPLSYRSAGVEPQSYSYTNDASLLLPTRALTRHYVIASFPNQVIGGLPAFGGHVLGGFITVVGVSDAEGGTTVTIRTTARISDPANRLETIAPGVRQFTLQQGEAVQLVGTDAREDLTGSIIESSQPVAVYVGNSCTQTPTGREACDHTEEQLLPVETWGRRVAVTAFRDRDVSHHVRIVSLRADNQLSFEGMPAPTECSMALRAGQACDFETNADFVVSGTQPILVMQYMFGQGYPLPECNFPADPRDMAQCMGDPAMVTEIPVDQFRHSYDFLVPATYVRNFINVLVPDGTRVRLDGTVLDARPTRVGAGLGVISLRIEAGAHHIEAVDDAQRIGIKVYGVAPYTSYAYPGGMDLARITPPG